MVVGFPGSGRQLAVEMVGWARSTEGRVTKMCRLLCLESTGDVGRAGGMNMIEM